MLQLGEAVGLRRLDIGEIFGGQDASQQGVTSGERVATKWSRLASAIWKEEIEAHHTAYEITAVYNRKPVPITEMIRLAEEVPVEA